MKDRDKKKEEYDTDHWNARNPSPMKGPAKNTHNWINCNCTIRNEAMLLMGMPERELCQEWKELVSNSTSLLTLKPCWKCILLLAWFLLQFHLASLQQRNKITVDSSVHRL